MHNLVSNESDNFEDFEHFEYQYLNHLNSFDSNPIQRGALTAVTNINGSDVRMEVDSGAGGTVMPIGQFQSLFPNDKWIESSRSFELYTGERVNVVGIASVLVTHKKEKHELILSIVNTATNALPLMGRDWLDILYPGWRDFFSNFDARDRINKMTDFDINSYKRMIFNKYKKVFSNDMFAPIKDFEAEIILTDNYQPIFSKAYSVPYGMLELAGNELDKLEKTGVIVRVKHSKVASPIIR